MLEDSESEVPRDLPKLLEELLWVLGHPKGSDDTAAVIDGCDAARDARVDSYVNHLAGLILCLFALLVN
jgi:hypothetical protein